MTTETPETFDLSNDLPSYVDDAVAALRIPEDDRQMIDAIADGILDKKGHDLRILDVRAIHSVFDYFVVVTANNPRQMRTIADAVEESARVRCGVKKRSIEGLQGEAWTLIDFGGVAVNIFSAEARSFYALERLWADAPTVDFAEAAASLQTN
ncbi:MAG: ribosome silencing factor [Acidimicrobiales bacterium]